jgi:hypothetical protein
MATILSQKHNFILTKENQENFKIEVQPTFTSLIHGQWDNKNQNFYIWSVLFALIAISIFAQITFPVRFNWIVHTISEQGSSKANPDGHLLWRIGVIINGIAHIPHLLYIKNNIEFIHSKLTKIFAIIGISSAIGFSLVGLISLDSGPIHYVFALLAFVGYYFAGNFTFIILHLKSNPALKYFKKSRWLKGFYLFFNITGLSCLFSFLFYETTSNQRIYPPVEWLFLISICLWLILWPTFIAKIKHAQIGVEHVNINQMRRTPKQENPSCIKNRL